MKTSDYHVLYDEVEALGELAVTWHHVLHRVIELAARDGLMDRDPLAVRLFEQVAAQGQLLHAAQRERLRLARTLEEAAAQRDAGR